MPVKSVLALLAVLLFVACSKDEPSGPGVGSIRGGTIDGRTLARLGSVQITTQPPSITILSDTAGSFTIPSLPSGTYVVTGRYTDSASGEAAVAVVAGQVTQADIVLSFGPVTTGSVVGAVRGEDGAFVSGAAVATVPATTTTTTNAQGSFTLLGMPPGSYAITATAGALSGAGRGTVKVGQITTVNLVLYMQDNSKGWVDGVVSINGIPLAGALMTISSGGETDITDADGKFHFSNVEPGTWRVTMTNGADVRSYDVNVTAGLGSDVRFELGFPTNHSTVDLIAYFPLNGDAKDVGPNGFDGTISLASFTTNRNGKAGSALVTAAASDGGAIVDHHSALNTLPLTLSAWIRIDDPELKDCLILGKNFHPNGDGYYLMLENQNLIFVYITNSFTRGFRVDRAIDPSKWNHVAMTVSGSVGTAYVNGVKHNMQKFGAGAVKVSTGGEFRMGSHQNTGTFKGFKGAIDDVFIYGRVLSENEIVALGEVSY